MTNEPKSDQTAHRSRARVATAAIAAGLTVVLVLVSRVIAGGTVGTALPPDFPVIIDVSLGVPVIGFGTKIFPSFFHLMHPPLISSRH